MENYYTIVMERQAGFDLEQRIYKQRDIEKD